MSQVTHTVESLVTALASEQSQRLKKERMLETLLMDETVARIKAEQVLNIYMYVYVNEHTHINIR